MYNPCRCRSDFSHPCACNQNEPVLGLDELMAQTVKYMGYCRDNMKAGNEKLAEINLEDAAYYATWALNLAAKRFPPAGEPA